MLPPRVTALALAAVLLSPAFGATAQELPRSGEFTVFFAHLNPHPFGAVPVGDGNVAFALTYVTGSVNAAGTGFMHNFRGRCVGLLTSNQAAGTSGLMGYCDWQDPYGDHIFESFTTNGPVNRVEGPLGGVQSHGTFVGGTGRYEGITGEVAITVFGATATPDGYDQVIGQKVGYYQLP